MIGLLMGLALGAAAPPAPAQEEMAPIPCAAPAVCRPAGQTSITGEDGSTTPLKLSEPTAYVRDGVVTLMPGEVIVVRLEETPGGELRPVLVSAGAADPAEMEPAVQSNLKAIDKGVSGPSNTYVIERGPRMAPVGRNQIRLSFVQATGKADSLLVVQDGYKDRWLSYRAFMVTPNGGAPTDVCRVQDGVSASEHWPHPILLLQLRDFRLTPPDLDADGNPVIHCE